MKKYLLLALISVFWITSCKKKTDKTEEIISHDATLNFTISESKNIASYNIYNNDQLVSQLATTSSEYPGQYTVKLEDIPHDPDDLDFEIEPMFIDSTGEVTNLEMKIYINEKEVSAPTKSSLLYNETATLAYKSE